MEQREAALQTVAMADSLDMKGVLYSDTVRLSQAVDALCRLTHRTEKAKALYYLGRNHSVTGEDATAVDYYIEADRLHPKDPRLKGRLYANMAYICTQQNKDSLAIVFYEKESRIWEELQNKDYFVSCQLDICNSLCKEGKTYLADSIWNQVSLYCTDDYLYSRAMGIRAYYYNICGQYDSALICLNEVVLPHVLGNGFYNAERAMALYYTNQLDSAEIYAKQTLSSNPSSGNAMIAYTVLREKAYKEKEIPIAMAIHDNVEALQKSVDIENEERIRAVAKLEQYLSEESMFPFPNETIIIIIVIVLIIVSILLYLRHARFSRLLSEKDNTLRMKENVVSKKIAEHHDALKANIAYISNNDWKTLLDWQNTPLVLKKIDFYFNNMASRLHVQYQLNDIEIRYCTMLLLNFDTRYISEHLPYSYSGMKTLKKRTSNKLFILPQNLSAFLTEFVLNFGVV